MNRLSDPRGIICLTLFLVVSATTPAQTNQWNVLSGTANWSVASNWTNNFAPANGGSSGTSLLFTNGSGGAAYTATNDFATIPFVVNQLVFSNLSANATTISGGDLKFTNTTAGLLPRINQNGSGAVILNNKLTLATNLVVSMIGDGAVTLNGVVSGSGSLARSGAGPGALLLTATNTFTGGTVLNQNTLQINNRFALGSGLVTLAGGNFQFVTTAMTFTNAITVTGNASLLPSAQTTLTGPLTVNSGATLSLSIVQPGTANTLIMPGSVSGAGNVSIGQICVAITNMNQLPSGNLNLGTTSGLTLSNVTWAQFLAGRPNGYGTGAGQFQGSSFAAAGSRLLINSVPTGILETNLFNRNFNLGIGNYDAAGNYYANAPVEVALNTGIAGAITIRAASQGPSTGAATNGFAQMISGNLRDGASKGAVLLGAVDQNTTVQNEIVLAGTNTWTGSVGARAHGDDYFRSGPGGLGLAVNNSTIWVRFGQPSSLPTGNGGSPSLIFGIARNNGTVGILMTESNAAPVYEPSSGSRFLFSDAVTAYFGGHGSVGDSALLRNADVLLNTNTASATAKTLNLLVRGGQLTLGDVSKPVSFIPSTGFDANAGDVNSAATTVTDGPGSRFLVKVGAGTLVLSNVAYTTVNHSGDTSAQFSWQINGGAVRGLADGDAQASNANSLKNFNLNLNGGVYEVDGGGAASSFTRATGTGANQVQWGNTSGFSAYNGPLTVNIGGAYASFAVNAVTVFGSQTANDAVIWANPLALGGSVREFQVIDNPNASGDRAVLTNVISGTAGNGLVKGGSGTLVLSANNSYSGLTTVSAGTLLVNGGLLSTTVVVNAGATLGGSGTLASVVKGAGRVAPGNSPGILAINQLDPGGALGFDFEFTTGGALATPGAPDYTQPTASRNDVLRLTNATPFFAALTVANTVNLYLNLVNGFNPSSPTNYFRGGFYTDLSLDFINSITNAQFRVYQARAGGEVSHGGVSYTYIGSPLFVRTVNEDLTQFGGQNGFVMEFGAALVPEHSTMLLFGLGGVVLLRLRQNRRA